MDYLHQTIDGTDLDIALFSENGVDELHLVARPAASGSFADQLSRIVRARDAWLAASGRPFAALVFSRYFVSDYANQAEVLATLRSPAGGGASPSAVSIIQQPPLTGNKVAAWFHLVHDRNRPAADAKALSEHDVLLRRGDYRHLWSARLTSADAALDSAGQTDELMRNYDRLLKDNALSLRDDCIRTWLFVKDVDFNYQGVVDARRELFTELGLTADTHYIASTGIEGRNPDARTSVVMDAYSVGGLAPGQIRFLEAREHLNPTHEYGVTFERGTSVDYGDRRHLFISGTASIDRKGEILHRNDVARQTARALENIVALLAGADATLGDVAQMIVYLRDIADTAVVRWYFDEHHRDIPKVFVLAPVCRPGWLVEVECIAIKRVSNPAYAVF